MPSQLAGESLSSHYQTVSAALQQTGEQLLPDLKFYLGIPWHAVCLAQWSGESPEKKGPCVCFCTFVSTAVSYVLRGSSANSPPFETKLSKSSHTGEKGVR